MKILKSILLSLLVISLLLIAPNIAFAQENFFDSPTKSNLQTTNSNDFFSFPNSGTQVNHQASISIPNDDFSNVCQDYDPIRIKVTNQNGNSVFATAEIVSTGSSEGLVVYGGGVHSPMFYSACERGISTQNFGTIRKDLGARGMTHLWTNVKNVLSGQGTGSVYCKDKTEEICEPYNGTWIWKKA